MRSVRNVLDSISESKNDLLSPEDNKQKFNFGLRKGSDQVIMEEDDMKKDSKTEVNKDLSDERTYDATTTGQRKV
eukprot:CAMPEP_0205804162 /NCGR_PEP_ID=MMETSP0205-20121125/6968_1 /ASSEMBLY_ACC=CAM_ASM_000278 /TAXON_ID=36767 /ORGANISM="Euplotes focardii, Strain TN1" /LENGTH=74 /DNA_ID=CAMNT_0053073269 /DNA_START=377 /DNA_END=602 /DNA_ORIENTATION=+